MSDETGLVLYSVKDIETMADKMAPAFKMPKEDLFTLMMIANAEGINPAHARQEYDIIKGRATLNSRSAQARFQKEGGIIEWITSTDKECTARFSHPRGSNFESTWTIQRAQRAQLTGKDNWKLHPEAMLRARVLAEGIRACYPACLSGLYTSEEIRDDLRIRNVTPVKTEVTKAPVFENREQKEDIPEYEPEPDHDEFELTSDPAESEAPPILEQWELALEDNQAGRSVIAWGYTQDKDIQNEIDRLLTQAEDMGDVNIGITRAMFLHPDIVGKKMKESDFTANYHFNNTIVPSGNSGEIQDFTDKIFHIFMRVTA